MASETMSGARAAFLVNGKKVAFTSSLSYDINQALEAVNVLDQLTPAEYAETGYTVTFSCQNFRRFNSSPIQIGVQQRLEDLLGQGELTVEVHDRQNPGSPMLLIERVKMQGRSGSFDARGLWQETWNFVGIKASDEAGV